MSSFDSPTSPVRPLDALSARLRSADMVQVMVGYFALLVFVLLFAWPAASSPVAARPNDSWFVFTQVKLFGAPFARPFLRRKRRPGSRCRAPGHARGAFGAGGLYAAARARGLRGVRYRARPSPGRRCWGSSPSAGFSAWGSRWAGCSGCCGSARSYRSRCRSSWWGSFSATSGSACRSSTRRTPRTA